jgi:hypothetical protein
MSHDRNLMNSEMVVSKLYETVDSTGRLDAQRLEQWLGFLRRRPAVEAFEALVGVFCNASRPDSRYLDQEYAGLRSCRLSWSYCSVLESRCTHLKGERTE